MPNVFHYTSADPVVWLQRLVDVCKFEVRVVLPNLVGPGT